MAHCGGSLESITIIIIIIIELGSPEKVWSGY
jgi:hypothetical protein